MRLYKYLFLVGLTALFGNTFAQQPKNDSVTVAIEPRYDKVGATHRLFFGESWRKIWAEPVKLRVFHINKEKGGLKITQLGGGMQTKSVRMEDENGQEWVLRSIQKYPERVLPPTLRKTIAATILDDQIVTEHPFAALTVPLLASALGVPHANPEIVYVPDDPALGEYRKDFANQVFLFEEREPLDARKTDNTVKTQDKLQEDNDNTVDQKIVLRARLLDMLLGDWDRHEDQWRWEKVKTDKGSIYKPVPRDRDQVFYNTSGVLPWLVSRHLLMAKFQSYEDHIRSINRWNLNARNFDRFFLNGLSEQDWREQIKVVQTALTDELINKAIKRMPPNIYQLSGPGLINKLIARRNILEKQALKYYRFISSKVEIPGTDKHEYFDITNQQDGQVKVTITKINKDGQREQVLYDRTFDPKVTSELRLYGLGNEDVFAVHGKNTSRIKLRMVGGDDKDTFKVDSNISGKGNRYVYDRSDEKNKLPKGGTAHLRTSTDTAVNKFLRLNYQYDFFQPLFLGSYNKDYGVQAITKLVWQKHGFQKDPYAFRQSLLINYGLGVSSLLLSYEGEFKQVIKKNDVIINVTNKGPNYVSNFFGIGNNSVFVNEGHKKIRYYRNVYNLINADFRLRHTYGNWTVSAGLAAQYYNGDEEDNNGKFLNDYNTLHPDEKVFASEANAGLVAGVTLDTRDKNIIPHKGVLWTTSLTGMKALNANAHNYGQIETDFSFLIDPWDNYKMVIANRTGVGTTLGTPSYYQLLKLGGNNNLRGFYNWRFTGKTMAFNNFEVRIKLFDYASYLLPGTVGVIAFDDVGRVWSPGERSNTWHTGYGGGLFFLPAQLILIQGVVGFSKDGAYPYISAGFRF